MLCCAEWILNISIEQYNYANNISDRSQGQKIKHPSHRCRTPPSYGRAALQNSFKFIVFQPPFCSLGCKFWIVGSSSQSHSFPFHLSITLGQLPPNASPKATFQLVKNRLELFSNGVCTWLARNSSTAELQLSYLGVYFDENLILVLASAGLSWLGLSALITLLSTQAAAAHNFPVCVCVVLLGICWAF